MLILRMIPFVMAILFVGTHHAQAQSSNIYIDVGSATIKRSLIALPAFQYFGSAKDDKKNLAIGQELFNVAYNDLLVSSYFTFIRQDAFLEDTSKVGLKPALETLKDLTFKTGDQLELSFSSERATKSLATRLA